MKLKSLSSYAAIMITVYVRPAGTSQSGNAGREQADTTFANIATSTIGKDNKRYYLSFSQNVIRHCGPTGIFLSSG